MQRPIGNGGLEREGLTAADAAARSAPRRRYAKEIGPPGRRGKVFTRLEDLLFSEGVYEGVTKIFTIHEDTGSRARFRSLKGKGEKTFDLLASRAQPRTHRTPLGSKQRVNAADTNIPANSNVVKDARTSFKTLAPHHLACSNSAIHWSLFLTSGFARKSARKLPR